MAINPRGRRTSSPRGNLTIYDSVQVALSGNGASSTSWAVTSGAQWNTVVTTVGTGSEYMIWSRRLNGLQTGTYVDTLVVTTGALTETFVDSLVIGGDGELVLDKRRFYRWALERLVIQAPDGLAADADRLIGELAAQTANPPVQAQPPYGRAVVSKG